MTSKRLKVAMLGNYPIYRFSGELGISPTAVQRVTSWNETLAEALAELPDLEIHFITRCNTRRTTTIRKNGLSITYLVAPRLLNAATLFGFTAWKANQLIKEINPHIVHGIGTEHIWPTVALMSGFPSVVTVHGIVNNVVQKLNLPLLSRQKLVWTWFSILERIAVRKARHLISISPYVMKSLGQFIRAKTYTIENPVALKFFEVNARPASSKQILFVGDTEQRKSLLTLLEAFSQLKENKLADGWHISVVGPIKKDYYYKKIMTYISENGLENQIVFKGFMLPDSLAKEYEQSAFLALSSIEETAPMCIAEAMAAGLPVVATNVSGVPYMVVTGQTGFLCAVNRAREMAEHMKTLMTNPVLRSEMGRRARALARERWDPQIIAKKTLEVYRAVVSKDS